MRDVPGPRIRSPLGARAPPRRFGFLGPALAIVALVAPVVVPVALAHPHVSFTYVGAGTVFGAPGEAAVYRIAVANHGDVSESIDFSITRVPAGWLATSEVSSLVLGPGEKSRFNLTVVPDRLPLLGEVEVTATVASTGTKLRTFVTLYQIVSASLAMEDSRYGLDEPVTGTVALLHRNGVGALGAAVRIEERWLGSVGAIRVTTGSTNAAGVFAFALGPDATGANLPGSHSVRAIVTYGGRTFEMDDGYAVY